MTEATTSVPEQPAVADEHGFVITSIRDNIRNPSTSLDFAPVDPEPNLADTTLVNPPTSIQLPEHTLGSRPFSPAASPLNFETSPITEPSKPNAFADRPAAAIPKFNFTDTTSIDEPVTPPPKVSVTVNNKFAGATPPSLVSGYDSDSSGSSETVENLESEERSAGSTPDKGSPDARPRRVLLKKKPRPQGRRVRFNDDVQIRYIPTNRANRLEEARVVQQEFDAFIDSLPMARISPTPIFEDPLENTGTTEAELDNELFRFQDGISDFFIDADEEDFALVDAEDKREELAQKNLRNRVAQLRNKLKRPREDVKVEENCIDDFLGSPELDDEKGSTIGVELELLRQFTTLRKNKKPHVTPSAVPTV